MFERKNILVFPCGSEIALELYRALVHSKHFNLIGASSVDDHGRFVYHNYTEAERGRGKEPDDIFRIKNSSRPYRALNNSSNTKQTSSFLVSYIYARQRKQMPEEKGRKT